MTSEAFIKFALEFLGVGGGASVVTFLILRKYGTNWLDTQFSKQLEKLRHEHAKELQTLHAEIDGALNATIRLQDREFEVLAEAWNLMNESYGAVQSHVNTTQTYQNINLMGEELRTEYVNKLDIYEAQKKEILGAADPYDELVKVTFWMKHNRATSANSVFNNYVFKNEIFMEKILAEKLKVVSRKLSNALISRETYFGMGAGRKGDESYDVVNKECHPLVEQLGDELRGYFFDRRA